MEATMSEQKARPISQSVTALFIADTQNIFYSARALHGNRARIDFLKLKDLAVNSADVSFLKSVAIVADFKLDDSVFMNFLRKFGYEIQSFSKEQTSHTLISSILATEGAEYDLVIIASGAGDLNTSYQSLKEANPDVKLKILSFADSLNKQVAEFVDEVIYLGTQVLIRPAKEERVEEEAVTDGSESK